MNFLNVGIIAGTMILLSWMISKVIHFFKETTEYEARVQAVRRAAWWTGTNNWLVAPTLKDASLAVLNQRNLKECRVIIPRDVIPNDQRAPAKIYVYKYEALPTGIKFQIEQLAFQGSTVILLS